MAEGCSRYIILGWGLSQDDDDSPLDIDDAEDFKLTNKAKLNAV